ncbi:MAG: enoyl-CoA hydratase-related protein [Actinomycetota bacterium]|nr:enoyl-CoA hydratase-related protein [Actinomycetota bacterium]
MDNGFEFVSTRTDDRVAVVTLNRPKAMNAISGAFAEELTEVFWRLRRDREVWVVVLAAAGERAFCVGADLRERAEFTLYDFYKNREQIRLMFSSLRRVPQPVVASVFGFALGGGFELALSCDLIVAAQDAVFGLPETRVGLIPAGGGTQLLTRKVGVARAKEMIFRGRRIDVTQATELGLVAEVAERDRLEERTMEVALDIARSSPVAVRHAKAAIDAALGVPLDEGMDLEHDAWRRTISSHDREEGILAFTEKRDPEWGNR